MRWEGLFADLEGQLDAQARVERDAEVAERTRAERASVDLLSRLVGQVGRSLRLRLVTGQVREAVLADLGSDWLLLRDEALRREALIPVTAVVGFSDLPQRSRQDRVARRFALGYALRILSRDRSTVTLTDTSGFVSSGTIDSVGADALDLSEHARDELRRSALVSGRRTVPFGALVSIESS